MNDLMMTVVGNVIRDVDLRFTGSADPVASFRVASNTRRFDRDSERWIEGDTHYLSVTCWRALATNVANSIKKGMPVVVYGRMRSREVERPCGDGSHTVRYQDIEAYAVGPDLARGTADFTRVKSASVAENETRVIADVMAAAAIAEEDGDDISGDTRDGQALTSA
ncbi:MAG: single-stranded DNA-binding protein [Actinomycetota bacterium]|nr:single-stranded DNA-binding protein [Actinomycetota bacterium]